jgi:hypothetical protein
MSEITAQRLAVLAYGSLLAHPGDWLGRNMQQLIRCETPFGVEYVGCAAKGRGGAPTLVRSDAHRKVLGGLIVLPHTDTEEGLAEVKEHVVERERASKASSIKHDLSMLGYRVVYSDFKPQFDAPTPQALAEAAIRSVAKCYEAGWTFMNGIRYLRENLEWGVITDLSIQYRDAILTVTNTTGLDEAEQQLIEAAKQHRDASHSG